MRGDRRVMAEALWPPRKFAFLYQKVPADIRRPVFEDGKLLGGVSATWLADRYVTPAVPRSAVELAVFSFLEIFIPGLIWCVLSGFTCFRWCRRRFRSG